MYNVRKIKKTRRAKRKYLSVYHIDGRVIMGGRRPIGCEFSRLHFFRRKSKNKKSYCYVGWCSDRNKFVVDSGVKPKKRIRFTFATEMYLRTSMSPLGNLRRTQIRYFEFN